MDRQIKLVTISLDALIEATRFKARVLLDQLEKDELDLHCFINGHSVEDAKMLLINESFLQYFDHLVSIEPTKGIFLTHSTEIDYPSVMIALGQRRPRLPLAIVLNLYAVDPLNESAILDGKTSQ